MSRVPGVLIVSLVLTAGLPAAAQDATTPPDGILDAIAAHAERYRATIPSLTAEETIVSTGPGFGPLRERAEARALFRVTHSGPDAPLVESRQFIAFNGRPVAAGRIPHLPLILQGAFGNATAIYFAPSVRRCLLFTEAAAPDVHVPERIDFKTRPELEAEPLCTHLRGVTGGYALVDRATGNIVHVERTVDPRVSEATHVGEFVAVDYAPLAVGAEIFWLPTRITAVQDLGRRRFVAEYGNYHRFTGTVTILPDVSPVATAPPR